MNHLLKVTVMLLTFIAFNKANANEGIFFKTKDGEEIRVEANYKYGSRTVQSISFTSNCTENSSYCSTNTHISKILDGFVDSVMRNKLYTYIYVVDDPCMDPLNNCTPFSIDTPSGADLEAIENKVEGDQSIATARRRIETNAPKEGAQPFTNFVNAVATQAGTETVTAIADWLKDNNGKGAVPELTVLFDKLSNGRNIPWAICKVHELGCTFIREVEFDNSGNKTTVTYPAATAYDPNYKLLFNVSSHLVVYFKQSEYRCTETFTGVMPDLKRQITCYYAPH